MCRGGALRPSMRTLGGEVVAGRWGKSPVRRELVGGVHGRLRCCTPVLYGARRSSQAARSNCVKSLRGTGPPGLSMFAPQAKLHVQTVRNATAQR